MFLLRRALGLVTTPPTPPRAGEGKPGNHLPETLTEIGDEPDPTTEEAPRTSDQG